MGGGFVVGAAGFDALQGGVDAGVGAVAFRGGVCAAGGLVVAGGQTS